LLLIRVFGRTGPRVVLGVAVAVAASDWPTGLLHSFWVGHPVITGLMTAVLFGVIASMFLEGWSAQRDEVRWHRVLNSSYRALIRSVCVSRDGLVMLVEGKYRFAEVVVGERPAIDPGVASAVAAQPAGLEWHERLEGLMQSPVWVEAVYRALHEMQLAGRRVLGEWAPLMIAADRLAPVFARVALFTDALEELERPFARARRDAHTGAIADSAKRELAARLWEELVTTAIKIEEQLRRDMDKGPHWKTVGRDLLSPRGVSEMDRCDAGEEDPLVDDTLQRDQKRLHGQYLSTHAAVSQSRSRPPPPTAGER
jgi:hypothetical protein